MNLSQLEYLIEVAKVGNISIASQILYISQAGISQAITSIEEELGTKVFKRTRAGVVLTEEGEKIVKEAEKIVSMVQNLKQFSSFPNTKVEEIKLSITAGFLPIVQNALDLFKQEHPDVLVTLIEDDSKTIYEEINHFKTDVGIIECFKYTNLNNKDISFEELFKSKTMILVNKDSTFASAGKITLQEYVKQRLAMYKSQIFIDHLGPFTAKFGNFKEMFISRDIENIKKIMIEKEAVAPFTEMFIKTDKDILNGKFVLIPLVDYDPIKTELISYGITYSKKRNLSTATKKLIEVLREQILTFYNTN